MKWIFLLSLVFWPSPQPKDNHERLVIESQYLNTQTEVNIHLVGDRQTTTNIIYLTDGGKLLEQGYLEELQRLHRAGKIASAYYVFVSSIDLTDQVDKRNTYFFCNEDYLKFFEQELIPMVEQKVAATFTPKQRALIGISFGGLNAAWFSAKSMAFKHFGLLSPITYPCASVASSITFSENEDLNIYISTGVNDAESYVGPLVSIYQAKGYQIVQKQTDGGHDFANWEGQIEGMLRGFFRP